MHIGSSSPVPHWTCIPEVLIADLQAFRQPWTRWRPTAVRLTSARRKKRKSLKRKAGSCNSLRWGRAFNVFVCVCVCVLECFFCIVVYIYICMGVLFFFSFLIFFWVCIVFDWVVWKQHQQELGWQEPVCWRPGWELGHLLNRPVWFYVCRSSLSFSLISRMQLPCHSDNSTWTLEEKWTGIIFLYSCAHCVAAGVHKDTVGLFQRVVLWTGLGGGESLIRVSLNLCIALA